MEVSGDAHAEGIDKVLGKSIKKSTANSKNRRTHFCSPKLPNCSKNEIFLISWLEYTSFISACKQINRKTNIREPNRQLSLGLVPSIEDPVTKTAFAAESWCFDENSYKECVSVSWRWAGKRKGLYPITGAAPLFRRIVRRTFSRFIHIIYLKIKLLASRCEEAETVTVKAEKAISINRRNLGHTMFPSNDLMSRNAQDISELFNREFEMFANRTKIAAGHTNSPMTCMSC